MNRRRLLWLCVPLALIAGVIAASFVLARRNADFVTVVPKSGRLVASYAALDATIDVADFHDCKHVGEAFGQLKRKLAQQKHFVHFQFDINELLNGRKREEFSVAVKYPAENQRMTVRQFLRMTARQTDAEDFVFLVGPCFVEVSTAEAAARWQAQNLDSLTLSARMESFWDEITGKVDYSPPAHGFGY